MRKQRILEHLSMMLKAIAYVVTAAIALSSAVSAQDKESDGTLGIGDPIWQKLLQDMEKYDAGLEAVRNPIRQELEKRKQEAQKTGVLRKLEEATKDVEAFENCDKLPGTLMASKPELTKQFRNGREKVQKQMILDFEAAIKDYTRLGNLAAAAAVKEGLEKFKGSLRSPPSTQKKKIRHRRR